MDNRKINEEIKEKYVLDKTQAIQGGDEVTEEELLPRPTQPKEPEKEDFVRKTKQDFGIDESFPEEEIDDKRIVLNKVQDKDDEYLLKAINNIEDDEQKIYFKYLAIGEKQKENKELTAEEKEFMKTMNLMYSQQSQEEKELNEMQRINAEKEKKIMDEYVLTKKNNPEKITTLNLSKNGSVDGTTSIPNLLKFILVLKTAKKKGGKILVKVTRDRSVFIEWTNKPITFIEFWTTDEKGTQTPEITRFNEFKYNFEGQPIPVLFAIQGYAEGFDFFGEFRKDITSEYVARIASKARHAGFLEGLNQTNKEKKSGVLGTLTEYMPLILILGVLILGWLMYTMYGEMAVLYETIKQLQQQLPMVVN